MANDFLKNMPPALKSLWQLENELRRSLQSAVLLRRADAEENMEKARAHMTAALRAMRGELSSAPSSGGAHAFKPSPPRKRSHQA